MRSRLATTGFDLVLIFAVTTSVAACRLHAKDACQTEGDCLNGRLCVAGHCQAPPDGTAPGDRAPGASAALVPAGETSRSENYSLVRTMRPGRSAETPRGALRSERYDLDPGAPSLPQRSPSR